jgi:lipopolysaccharide transport system permease protein
MLLTPVIYPVPATGFGSILPLLNPVSPVLDTTREWLFSGSPQFFTGFLAISGFTLFALVAGWLLYRLALPILIERMSA